MKASTLRVVLRIFLVSALLAACSTEVPREGPYDPDAPADLQSRAEVAGTVLLEDETDFAGVDIQLQSNTNTYAVATDGEGAFRVTGIVPGEYELRVTTKYFESVEETVKVELGANVDLRSRILAAKRVAVLGNALAQRVVNDALVEEGGVLLTLRRVGSIRGASQSPTAVSQFQSAAEEDVTTQTGKQYSVISGGSGSFQIDDVPAGIYALEASGAGLPPTEVGGITVTGEDGDVQLDPVLLRPVTGFFQIVGSLVGGSENTEITAVPNVTLRIIGNAEHMAIGEPDGDDVCVFDETIAFENERSHILSAEGENTVCVRLIGGDGDKTITLRRSILLDRVAPSFSSVQINNGAAYATSSQATLSLLSADDTSGVKTMIVGRDAAFTGSSPQSYLPALVYPLTAGDGLRTVYVRYGDRAGHYAAAVSASIIVDTIIPIVTLFQVEDTGGDALTDANSARVVVHLVATDANPRQMMVSNRSDFAGSTWQPYQEYLQWDLPLPTNPNGESRTVYAKVRDAAGHTVDAGSWTLNLDTIAPSGVGVDIVQVTTNNPTVDVNFTYSNADWIEISPDVGFQTRLLFSARASTTYTFAGGDGTKALYARFLDDAGNVSATVADQVIIDTTPPQLASFTIEQGTITNQLTINLSLSAVDATEMQIGEDTCSATWEPFATGKAYSFASSVDGMKTIAVRYRDAAGNTTSCLTKSIKLDRTLPVVTLFQAEDGSNNVITATNKLRYFIRLTASDATSLTVQYSPTNVFSSAVSEPLQDLRAWDVAAPTNPEGENRTTYVRIVDGAGNAIVLSPLTVLVDTIAPSSHSMTLSASLVSSPTVNVALGANFATNVEISEDIGFLTPTIIAYTTNTTHTFSNTADGTKNLYARFVDNLGNYSSIVQASTVLDTTPPDNANFSIVQTSPTKESTLNLQLTANGATQMSISEGTCTSNWESYAQTKAHVLSSSVPGTYTIAVWYRDGVDNRSACITRDIELDNVPPELLATPFQINNGAALTSQSQVTLSFKVTGATELRVSTDISFADVTWIPYAAARDFLLPGADGSKTIHAQFRDAADNRTVILDQTILLDTAPPEISIVQLDGGAAYAASMDVEVTVVASGDPVVMNIRDEAGDLYEGNFAAVTTVTFSAGTGVRTLSVKLWDAAGNGSERIFRSIEVDLDDPRGAILIANGAARVPSESVTLNLTAVDDGSGVRGIKLANASEAALPGETEVSFDATKAWTLDAVAADTEALRTVWYQVFDKAGNASAPVSDTVIVDKLAPLGTIGLSAAVTNQTLIGVDLSYVADTTHMKISAGDSCAGGNWVEVAPEALWTLSSIDGQKYVSVRYRDAVGNLSMCYPAGVILDTQGPTPTQLVLTGSGTSLQGYSDSPTITVAYGTSAVDCLRAEFAEDVGFISVLHSAVSCTASIPYTFSNAADGFKNLYLRYLDNLGNVGPVTSATIVVDSTDPLVEIEGGFTIAQGEWVNDPNITLQLSASGATRVRNGEGGGCGFTPAAYATTKGLTLSGGDAAKTVSLQYLDDAGNASACYARTVTLDTFIATFTLSLQGHDGFAGTTASQAVTVTVVGVDVADAVEMRVSNVASFTGSSWESLATSFSWFLPSGDGTKDVFMAIRDRAGNVADASGAIILDQTPPDAPALQMMDIDGDGFALSATTVELTWSQPSGAVTYELQQLISGRAIEFYPLATFPSGTSSYADLVTMPGFKHSYRIRSADAVGNLSGWSAIVEALPFEPISAAYWIHDAQGLMYYFPPNAGTFSLLSVYAYATPAGSAESYSLTQNAISWRRPESEFLGRLDERLDFKLANQDSSLVYDVDMPLNLHQRLIVDNSAPYSLSIASDSKGNLHVAYTYTDWVRYATNKSGAWVSETLDTGNMWGYGALALDNFGGVHISYYHGATSSLKYVTNASGVWVAQTVGPAEVSDSGVSIVMDSAGKAHISYRDALYNLSYITNASGIWVNTVIASNVYDPFYTSIALDALEKVHIAYSAEVGGYQLTYVTNKTGGWVSTVLDPANFGIYSLALAVDAGGKVHIAYFDYSVQQMKYVTDKSGGWVIANLDASRGWSIALALDDDGFPHITYTADASVRYATNRTGMWQTRTIDAEGTPGQARIAIDYRGALHFVYGESLQNELKHLQSYSPPVAEEATGMLDINAGVSVAVAPDGIAHGVYRNNGIRYVNNATGSWVGTTILVGSLYTYPSIAVDQLGKVHIAFAGQELYYATNTSGTWVLTILEGSASNPQFPSIAIDADGFIHISYRATAGVKYRTNRTGSWTVETLAAEGRSSIAVDSLAKAHIVSGTSTVQYATNQSGSWEYVVLDTNADLYYSISNNRSIAVDPLDKVHLVYRRSPFLRYATNVSGTWVINTPDEVNANGQSSAIAVDADGAVHLSYFSNSTGDIRYASNASGIWAYVNLVPKIWTEGAGTSIAIDSKGQAHVVFNTQYWPAGDPSPTYLPMMYITRFHGKLVPKDTRLSAPF